MSRIVLRMLASCSILRSGMSFWLSVIMRCRWGCRDLRLQVIVGRSRGHYRRMWMDRRTQGPRHVRLRRRHPTAIVVRSSSVAFLRPSVLLARLPRCLLPAATAGVALCYSGDHMPYQLLCVVEHGSRVPFNRLRTRGLEWSLLSSGEGNRDGGLSFLPLRLLSDRQLGRPEQRAMRRDHGLGVRLLVYRPGYR